MIATQHETQQTVAQAMLQSIVEAICDRPEETAARRDARSRDVVYSVLGFEPRDAVEIMLAGMAVTHAHLIQDSARDVTHGLEGMLKARTKSTVVALDRGMVGFLKELRLAQARPVEGGATAEAMVPAAPRAEVAKAPVPSVARTMPPEPPFPPLRRAETSVAASMAVLSPPTTPCAVTPAKTSEHALSIQAEVGLAKQERAAAFGAEDKLAGGRLDRGIVGYDALARLGTVKGGNAV
jgi:hypothetical protein